MLDPSSNQRYSSLIRVYRPATSIFPHHESAQRSGSTSSHNLSSPAIHQNPTLNIAPTAVVSQLPSNSSPPTHAPHLSSNPALSVSPPFALLGYYSSSPVAVFSMRATESVFKHIIVSAITDTLLRYRSLHFLGLQISRVGLNQERSQILAIVYTDAHHTLWDEAIGKMETAISDQAIGHEAILMLLVV